jgi:methionyl-tRNA synthetase
MLKEWTRSGAIHESVANKLEEWFSGGLRDWDISRDSPYFGFEIPGHPGKYFYVWLDAPVGYMAASLALAKRDGLSFDDWWSADSTAELHHFIGKDILYFHTLFWPAVLQGAGYRRPTQVHAHGFLTVNGQKMSKSRGTFITGRRYLERLPPEPLRYYFAAKLGPGIDDMDLSLEDFVSRFNSDVVGKLVNIASRCAGFVARGGGHLAPKLPDPDLYEEFAAVAPRMASLYESRDFIAAIREIAALADRANQYIDAQKPWNLAKDPARADDVLAVCTQGINLFRTLMTYLAPVLPAMAERAGKFLGHPILRWDDVQQPLLGSVLASYEPLATRLDPKVVATLIEETPATAPAPTAATPPKTEAATPANAAAVVAPPSPNTKGEITIDDFSKLDLRVGKVLECGLVDGSDKLLRLQIDLGNGDVRQIFSGIRESYSPETMIGRQVVVIANLKPRKMRFGISQGMVLCASTDSPGVFLVSPDEGGAPGMTVT